MKPEILMTFNNGGKMYKLLPEHKQFLKSLKIGDITILVKKSKSNLNFIEYKKLIVNILNTGIYKSGKEQTILNELRKHILTNRKTKK